MFAIKEFPYRRPLDTIFKPLVSYAIVNQFLVQTLNVLMVFQSHFSRAFKTKYKKIKNMTIQISLHECNKCLKTFPTTNKNEFNCNQIFISFSTLIFDFDQSFYFLFTFTFDSVQISSLDVYFGKCL